MDAITNFFEILLHADKLIQYGGLTLLLIIVFAETGLFFGFFLPGDYLLFAAGLFCGTSHLEVSIELLTLSVMGAAIAGDFTGYASGRFFGNKLFAKKDSLFFKKEYVKKTEIFFAKYGNATLILGRYFPIIRTFAPILAGVTKMNFLKFTIANFSGGCLWVLSLVPTGYYIGKNHPEVIDYISYIVAGFFILTAIPLLKTMWTGIKMKGA